MREHLIIAIGGDGIGPEVISAGLTVLEDVARRAGDFRLTIETLDWGSERYLRTGSYIPEGGLARLQHCDAIFFGAVGSREVPDHVSLWGLRLPIAQGFDQYANVRPARVLPGVKGRLAGDPAIDWIILRENSEGEYAGNGGRTHRGLAIEVATETAVFTRAGVSRIHRYAFELARRRPRKRLTLVTKSNALRYGLVLWDEVFYELAREYPDVSVDRELVDACAARMVSRPESLDVLVATNLHADILSDLAAALSGSLGIAATANLNPERAYPSMFEPIHGSALDIAGQGIANPIGAFWSASLMLEHLGEPSAAAHLLRSIERVSRAGVQTPDLGGTATTLEVTRAVCDALGE
jgi:tartrate dehydrogenase/decarboxylase/D-malate dehydrogenase